MRKSISTEIVMTVLIGVAGALLYNAKLINFMAGFIILFLNGYFIIPKFKEHTIKEYIQLSQDKRGKE